MFFLNHGNVLGDMGTSRHSPVKSLALLLQDPLVRDQRTPEVVLKRQGHCQKHEPEDPDGDACLRKGVRVVACTRCGQDHAKDLQGQPDAASNEVPLDKAADPDEALAQDAHKAKDGQDGDGHIQDAENDGHSGAKGTTNYYL